MAKVDRKNDICKNVALKIYKNAVLNKYRIPLKPVGLELTAADDMVA